MNQKQNIDISIVIPVYNEERNISILFSKLEKVLETINKNVEIIFIDDGSSDCSFAELQKLKNKAKIIKFKRNFGQTAALSAGFTHAKGEAIITMDADLQNDPGDIPLLIDKIENGCDIVSGWRKKRKDSFFSRRLPSFFANHIISWCTGVYLHDYGCTLKAYKKELVKKLNLYGELHRFIPALLSWSGASIKEVEVKHYPRKYGRSKYNIFRTINVVLDLITVKFILAQDKGPMRIFGKLGLLSIFFGLFSGLAVIFMKLAANKNMTGNPFLYLTIFFIFIGLQFISMGLLGEINIRTYTESQQKKIYKIDKIIN
jgi:glycosyltransferase involved in cell wall biosynthesis